MILLLSLAVFRQVNAAKSNCMSEAGYECVFPFIFEGITFASCTLYNSGRSWCALKVDDYGLLTTGDWSYCQTGSDCGEILDPNDNETLKCDPPAFTGRFQDPADNMDAGVCADAIGSTCTPVCGDGFQASSPFPITCTSNGWTAFGGCYPSHAAGEVNHPQCLEEGVCNDDDECTEDYCDAENRCVGVPISGCYECKTVADCPSGGSCRQKYCDLDGSGWQVCLYEYTQCWDGNTCTADFCMHDQCVHQTFSLPPLVPVDQAAPLCSSEPMGSIYTVDMTFDRTAWPSADAILKELQDCSGIGGVDIWAKMSVRDFLLNDGPTASARVFIFQQRRESIVRLGELLINLLRDGFCDERLKDSVRKHRAWENCIISDFSAGVFTELCMGDPAGLAQANAVFLMPKKKNAGLVVFLVLLILFGLAGGVYYYRHEKRIRDSLLREREKGTIDGIPEAAKEELRQRLTPTKQTSDQESKKHKRIWSYSFGGTRTASLPVARERLPGSGRKVAPMDGSINRQALDNSQFAPLASGDWDEDQVDPMAGWDQRDEGENPPEVVVVELPVGEIQNGPKNINVACPEGMELSEFLLAVCRKIDAVSQQMGNTGASAESALARYSLVDANGKSFKEADLWTQLRRYKKSEQDRIAAKLIKN